MKGVINMYKAIDIAKYVINRCISCNNPISNLQLQKILYYIQGKYIEVTNGECLFEDKMEAWQYGPVVPEVYYLYSIYSSTKITDNQICDKRIKEDVMNIIDPVIDEKSRISAWNLVQSSHKEIPWMNNYSEGEKREIPISSLKQQFICRS